MTWHPLSSADDAFLSQAPLRTCRQIDIAAPPEAVWAVLSADDAVVSWSVGVTATRWATGAARGVGSVREVTVAGLITVRERFYRWDAPHRQTFGVEQASRLGIRRFAEDYQISDVADGSRLTWVLAIEPSRLPRGGAALARPALALLVDSMLRAIRRQAENSLG